MISIARWYELLCFNRIANIPSMHAGIVACFLNFFVCMLSHFFWSHLYVLYYVVPSLFVV